MTSPFRPDPPSRPRSADSAEGCALTLVGLVIVPFIALYDGWAFHLMWRWFVVPATGFAELGVWQAIGLLAIWPIVNFRYSPADQEVEDSMSKAEAMGRRIAWSVVATTMALGIGWLVHTFAL